MSAKYFCDVCGDELAKVEHDRIRRTLNDVSVEVMTCFKTSWNVGHVCHKCIIDVIMKGKPQ